MRTQEPYVALCAIQRPGTMVNGYQRGDGVTAEVVEAWDLVVGEQVVPFDTGVIARPTSDGTREEWQAYAIGQGMDPADAGAASLDDLRAAYPESAGETRPLPVPGTMPERPEHEARKAEWVAYAVAMGADKAWAEDKSTTKAELQDWDPSTAPGYPTPTGEPEVGDPLATEATRLANG